MAVTDGPESVEQALQDALEDADEPMARRVLRSVQGKMARPAAFDYVTAMTVTDGAVALELDFADDRDRVVFRYLPDSDAFERYGDFQSSGEDVGRVGREAVTRWAGRYGVVPVLEADVAELFEEANRVRTDGGHLYDGP